MDTVAHPFVHVTEQIDYLLKRHWQRAAWPFQCTRAPAATPLPATWTFYPPKFTPSHKGIANFSTDLFFLDVGGFSSLPTVSAIYFHYSFLPPPSISYVFTPHYVSFTLTYAAIWLEDINALSVPWYFCPLLSFFFFKQPMSKDVNPICLFSVHAHSTSCFAPCTASFFPVTQLQRVSFCNCSFPAWGHLKTHLLAVKSG